ncbi:hypothetical protein I6A60_12310 [Frankia sp. AgB1.9]|nr:MULTISPECIES: hypothetical protein [unclassified Frankia]MBL7548653.1 hypothetical protein [Frankia sp. AgB1.9]MBL7623512.1 hypothetical protein [Frankia sp. AgB1.8]
MTIHATDGRTVNLKPRGVIRPDATENIRDITRTRFRSQGQKDQEEPAQ